MSKKIIGEKIEPKCKYCLHGKPTPDKKNILCTYCGLPDTEDSCKKFKYDPLKREPHHSAQLAEFTADDFKL